ncbi:MAG: carbohydrate porin [Gemmatimonadota bacterium]|nr:carbohydrate porin [Gemmatimonadota bacterium]
MDKASHLAATIATLGLVLATPTAGQQTRILESVAAEVAYTGEVMTNVRGGVRRGARYLDNLDATLEMDLEQAFGWSGATIFLYGLGNHGGEPSELVGEAQTVSNIEAPSAWRLYEAWIEQSLAGGVVSVRAGLYDLNSEFDALESSSLFINSSHGIGPNLSQTGNNGPSIFPLTSLSLRVRVDISNRVHAQAAVLDGVPGDPDDPTSTRIHLSREDGALVVGELGIDLGDEGDPDGRIAVGAFYYTSDFEHIDSDPAVVGMHGGNSGAYALAERRVEHSGTRDTWAFVRGGRTDPHVNRFTYFLGTGVVSTGLIAARPDDNVGLGVAMAVNGSAHREATMAAGATADRAETVFELTYLASLPRGFWIQPDLQYVINPDTDPSRANALVIGTRAGFAF